MNWIDSTGLSSIGRYLAGQGSGAAESATLGDRLGRAIQDGVDSLGGRLSPQSKPSVPTQPDWNHADPYANPIPISKPYNTDWSDLFPDKGKWGPFPNPDADVDDTDDTPRDIDSCIDRCWPLLNRPEDHRGQNTADFERCLDDCKRGKNCP